MDYFFVQTIISYFLRSICLCTHVRSFFTVSLLNCRTRFSVQHVRVHVRTFLLNTDGCYTRTHVFLLGPVRFFAKKRTTGYVRTTGTGTGVKRSVFYELYRIMTSLRTKNRWSLYKHSFENTHTQLSMSFFTILLP